MKALQIKKLESVINLEPVREMEVDQILITIRQWTGDGMSVASMRLNLLQVRSVITFFCEVMRQREDQLSLLESRIKKQRFTLEQSYTDSQHSGLFTYEQLSELKKVDLSISHLLAKDLGVSVEELYRIIQLAPLPFALFDKHYSYCKEQVGEMLGSVI